MNFFCIVHMLSKKEQEDTFFIILEKSSSDEIPQLSKEMILANQRYLEFRQKYKPKTVAVDYIVYSTENEINAAMPDEELQKLTETSEKHGQSEIIINCIQDKLNTSGKKKKKKSPVTIMIAVFSILIVGVFGVGFGMKVGKSKAAVQNQNSVKAEKSAEEDGLLIPEQVQNEDAAQQITVSIDRSYSAVPTEDLQLKGSVVDGKAQITLPEFDKTDFFTHVAGYTWGFSSDPDAKRIEYYGGKSYTFTEDTKLYRVLVKYGGGSGTKDDPYLIDYYDQLELMSEEKARGYFKQTADIVFPDWATHTPIDTVNELKSDPDSEHFEYDGDGYVIKNLDNPLFGKVSGAVIRNVNVRDSVLETTEYKDYGFIVCSAYNYRYTTEDGTRYETGETLIQHCTVSHSSILARYPQTEETQATEVVTAPVVVPPDLVEYDESGNIIEKENTEPVEPTRQGEHAIGAITGLGGQIENCYVTDFGISAYLDDYYLYAGGISGKPANVINSAVYYFSAKGKIFNGGGIAGSISGARMYNPAGKELPTYYGGNIQGCTARKIILYTEVSAGGIAGEGGTSKEGSLISNCYTTDLTFSVGVFEDSERENLKKAGVSGGIIGTDGKEQNGHLITATVSPAELPVIGSKKVSEYDTTIRLAPAYAFYQQNILSVINQNSINPENPKEIFAGNFKFGSNTTFGDESGSLAYPAEIEDLFAKTITEEST